MLYVSHEELAEFLGLSSVGGLPASTRSMVRRASGLVGDAIIGARYATDAEGYPTDPRVRAALAEATSQQVSDWIDAGVDPAKGVAQLPAPVAAKSALGVSVTYAPSSARSRLERLAAGESLTEAATGVLRRAGLLHVVVGGPSGDRRGETYLPTVRVDPLPLDS